MEMANPELFMEAQETGLGSSISSNMDSEDDLDEAWDASVASGDEALWEKTEELYYWLICKNKIFSAVLNTNLYISTAVKASSSFYTYQSLSALIKVKVKK